jgi:putative transposase
MVTASTLHGIRLFCGEARLRRLTDLLLSVATRYQWDLHAWAVFENHYHFIGVSPDAGAFLDRMLGTVHSLSAREINQEDGTPGRRVWFQYRDTCITHSSSYFARLRYVMENPVKHRLVQEAERYPFCSAARFLATAEPALIRRVHSFGTDRVNVPDDD